MECNKFKRGITAAVLVFLQAVFALVVGAVPDALPEEKESITGITGNVTSSKEDITGNTFEEGVTGTVPGSENAFTEAVISVRYLDRRVRAAPASAGIAAAVLSYDAISSPEDMAGSVTAPEVLPTVIHKRCITVEDRPIVAAAAEDGMPEPEPEPKEDLLLQIRQAEAQEQERAAAVDVGNVRIPEIQLSGSGNAENGKVLWDYCKMLGFTDAGAAATLGNLAVESGLNPAATTANFDPDKGTGGGGLAGWMCRGRFKGLLELAAKRGVPWQDLSLQAEYLAYELEHTRAYVGDAMKAQTDVDYATDYFCVYFEGCVGHSPRPELDENSSINGNCYQMLAKRKAYAREYYRKYSTQE